MNRISIQACHPFFKNNKLMNSNYYYSAKTFMLLSLLFVTCFSVLGLEIDPSKCVIVEPSQKSPTMTKVSNKTVKDLAKHFKLVFGVKPKIVKHDEARGNKFKLFFDIVDPADKKPFSPRECRWSVTDKGIYFYGDPAKGVHTYEAANSVYFFLENKLGIHWIRPGDEGIVYKKATKLNLKKGIRSHVNRIVKRGYRGGARRPLPLKPLGPLKGVFASLDNILRPASPDPLKFVREYNQYVVDEKFWRLRRMRFYGDGTGMVRYGHAFCKWWDMYGAEHPEYFALNKWGQRAPTVNLRHRPPANYKYTTRDKMFIKLCVSNEATIKQVVENWKKRMLSSVSACQNDGAGYCRCTKCLALDSLTKAQSDKMIVLRNVSDRYAYFASRIAEEVNKIKPGTLVGMYAYNATFLPPRTQKVHPNVMVASVIRQINEDYLEKIIGGWHDAGAKRFMIRTNLPYYFCSLALPLGAARQMHKALQYCYKKGAIGFDYDHLMLLWTSTGLTDYAICKAMLYPDAPFEKWEDEYCSAFGNAAGDVKKYFRYWEKNFDKNFMSDYVEAVKKNNAITPFHIIWNNIQKYFNENDFDVTDAILEKAWEKNLSKAERKRLKALMLVNKDSRLLVRTRSLPEGPKRYQANADLLSHREKYGSDYGIDLARTMGLEMTGGSRTVAADNIYYEVNAKLKEYPQPWFPTRSVWRFKADPSELGIKEKWYDYSAGQISRQATLSVNGQRRHPSCASEANKRFLYKYKGTAWYFTSIDTPIALKGRKNIIIYFHSLGNNAQVYIDGKLCGKQKGGPSSLTLDIGSCIDWKASKLRIAVRQEGTYGIVRRPWIAGKTP